MVEGACATKKVALFNAKWVFYNTAFSLSLATRASSLPEGALCLCKFPTLDLQMRFVSGLSGLARPSFKPAPPAFKTRLSFRHNSIIPSPKMRFHLCQNNSTPLTLWSARGGGTGALAGAIVCYLAPQKSGIKRTHEPLTNATLNKSPTGKFLEVWNLLSRRFQKPQVPKPV